MKKTLLATALMISLSSSAFAATNYQIRLASGASSAPVIVIPDWTLNSPVFSSIKVGDTFSFDLNTLVASIDQEYIFNSMVWTASGLPAGLTLDQGTGFISGTATSAAFGDNPVSISADFNNKTENVTSSLSVGGDIGMALGGGVVAYMGSTFAIVAAANDQSASVTYGCLSTLIAGAYNIQAGDGATNSNAALATCPGSVPAVSICDNSTEAGYSDWFVPARLVGDNFYTHKAEIGGFASSGAYWISTHHPSDGRPVQKVDIASGSTTWGFKNESLRLRCVRKVSF